VGKVLVVLALIVCAAGGMLLALALLSHWRTPSLGGPEAGLMACPSQPNCVNSLTGEDRRAVAPFAYQGQADQAWDRLRLLVQSVGGVVQQETEGYLWATFRSPVWRFVDDLELYLDQKNKLIHVRSASRVGYSDLGVNAKRVARLHACWAEERANCSK